MWLVPAAALAVLLTGCGGDAQGPGTSDPAEPSSATAPVSNSTAAASPGAPSTSGKGSKGAGPKGSKGDGDPTSPGDPDGPAVSGKVISVDDMSAVIEGSDLEVRFTTGTTFVRTVDASAKEITAGACVIAFPEKDTEAGAQRFRAAWVQVRFRTGGCDGVGARNGPNGQAAPTECRAEGRDGEDTRDGRPSASAEPRPGCGMRGDGSGGIQVGGAGIVGTVTAVDDSTLTVSIDGRDQRASVEVQIVSSTRVHASDAASATTVQPGQCLTAWGQVSPGAVTATRIRVASPTAGSCPH